VARVLKIVLAAHAAEDVRSARGEHKQRAQGACTWECAFVLSALRRWSQFAHCTLISMGWRQAARCRRLSWFPAYYFRSLSCGPASAHPADAPAQHFESFLRRDHIWIRGPAGCQS
jgi:hypothetical protein